MIADSSLLGYSEKLEQAILLGYRIQYEGIEVPVFNGTMFKATLVKPEPFLVFEPEEEKRKAGRPPKNAQ